jgi:hypothetical protein
MKISEIIPLPEQDGWRLKRTSGAPLLDLKRA